MLAPIVALVWEASHGSEGLWGHLATYVLLPAFGQTVILLAGVGAMVTVLGTTMAWLVAAYEFPGRRFLEWALLLPLAMPTYIIAYSYLDLLHPLGPVQEVLRSVLGFDGPRDFRLPDIRSMTGAVLLLGFVLYPYVYLPVRAMFLMQAANLIEAGRMLGCSHRSVFLRLALPLARPGIAAGVSLALMEALNDIGASEFLGVRTLTVSVYTTWVTRSDLSGAAQIALAMLLLVVLLVAIERWARRGQRFAGNAQRASSFVPVRLSRGWAFAALVIGLVPVVIGFGAPAAYLFSEALQRWQAAGIPAQLVVEIRNTVMMAGSATILVLICGAVIAYAGRVFPGPATGVTGRVAALGYAMPGTVIAIGVLIPVAGLDRILDSGSRMAFGVPVGLVLIGSGVALAYAYMVRFLAIGVGSVEAGFARIPRSLDHAARSLGHGVGSSFMKLHLPLSGAPFAAAALLVFVDAMKELPATLLLRPLNFETLATRLYGEAARGTHEDGAMAALAIVLAGIAPVILLARIGRRKPVGTP
ncbi:ABC transporter permease [Allitabrizicola rongguiensis]|uniref:ABC transporter permease n=1 Tax=Alitabrizicola rongguiensis TaxID=2909234 RepID=UPI001F17EDE3|nr:iron ABC transporter permease [Tabrizicola rongguiensis]